MEEVDEGQMARGHWSAAVVAVETEEISVVAGGNLGLHTGNGEFLHPELVPNQWQYRLDPFQDQVLVMRQIHEDAGAAVFIIDDAAIRARRNYFAAGEVSFVVQREAHEFFDLLWRQELV